jgi:nucleotide-binding universal stress UspA family protein
MMKLFERIVIATDGSKAGRAAVTEGLRIGKECDARIFVVSVIDTRALSSVSPEIQVAPSIDQMQSEAERIVRDVEAMAAGQKVETFILSGDPVQEITKFSVARKANLVIVGTQGKHGLERFILGSVAEGIVRHAACPVLVVKNETA